MASALMTRKRCQRDTDAADVVVMELDSCTSSSSSSNHHADSGLVDSAAHTTKRRSGPSHPAPGELSHQTVATYLHSLSSHLNNLQLEHAGQVLTPEGWQVGVVVCGQAMCMCWCTAGSLQACCPGVVSSRHPACWPRPS
jgi:hypothetical protein